MPTAYILAYLAVPTALCLPALLALMLDGPRQVLRVARWATLASLAAAVAAMILVACLGPLTSPLLGIAGIGLSLRLDWLSVIMFLLVAFIGSVVVQFSRTYLDGEPRQGHFIGALCLTLAAILMLVLAGNLAQLTLAWIATSLALHDLLLFYPQRAKARLAARKKFRAARLGDLCLIGGAILLAVHFGTTDIGDLLATARAGAPIATGLPITVATGLLVTAAVLKSAQFPAHGWLPEVMETPTPVSALLHAGVINAGGFLMIRLADVMMLSPSALHALAVIGGFSALFGSVVMLTQNSVKVALAWSTIAQMGFMLLQCGLGAFALALLHLIAHALYKAHAFLNSGTLDPAIASVVPKAADRPPATRVSWLAVILVLLAGSLPVIGVAVSTLRGEEAVTLTFATIFVLGLALALVQAMRARPTRAPIGWLMLAGFVLALCYVAWHAAAVGLMQSLLPPPSAAMSPATWLVITLTLLSFALVTGLQIVGPPRPLRRYSLVLRVHLANGLYANAIFNRLFHTAAKPRPVP